MHLTIPLCPSAGKMLSSVTELVVETLPEAGQSLEAVRPPVGTQAPVFLPDQRIVLSSLCVPCPNSLDPRMCTVLALPCVPALFEKVLYHFPS